MARQCPPMAMDDCRPDLRHLTAFITYLQAWSRKHGATHLGLTVSVVLTGLEHALQLHQSHLCPDALRAMSLPVLWETQPRCPFHRQPGCCPMIRRPAAPAEQSPGRTTAC